MSQRTNAYTLAYRRDGAWVKQGDLSKKLATAAARELRAAGMVAFIYRTAQLHLYTFA